MTLAWWDVLTQTQQQHQKDLYTVIYTPLPEYFFTLVIAFCFSFLCSILKRNVEVHVAYLLRPTLVHIGIEGRFTAGSRDNRHTSIYFTLFRVPHELVNGVRKIKDLSSCQHTHLRNKLLIQEPAQLQRLAREMQLCS